MNVLSLFAGIEGLGLGLERAGMTVVGQVEINPFCRQILDKHWPEVPKHDDVRTTVEWWQSAPRPAVDLVCGGFPCQPVSFAGRGLAQADPRWLWPAMRDVVEALRPRWVVGENVPGLRNRGLDLVHADLEALGYTVETRTLSACSVGAPHMRRRLFIVAHTDGAGPQVGPAGRLGIDQAGRWDAAGGRRWPAPPDVDRVVDGLPRRLDRRVDRIRALGNAVSPPVAEALGRLIVAADENRLEAVA